MTEPIRCPGCSTRFALRAERVHAGIRRAKCFRCDTVFPIGEAVDALLATLAPPPLPEPPPPAVDLPVAVPGEIALPVEVPAPADPGAPMDLSGPGAPEAGSDVASLFARFDEPPPSLTLGDLEGAEEEILEKTLVIPPPEEAPAEPSGFSEPSEPSDPAATGSYSSAKDAISKLMGDVPAPAQGGTERRFLGTRSPMDVEATLTALEDTLSGSPAAPDPGAPMEATTSTMKLTAQEIQEAMTSYRPQPAPAPRFLQDTQPIPTGTAQQATQPIPVPQALQAPLSPEPGTELLKIQGEQETLTNVSVDQVIAWIEQGRVREYHMVARQFSDHWIEAIKVPALRPAFDRKRREDAGRNLEPAAPPPDLAPARKSLFGGLFGRN